MIKSLSDVALRTHRAVLRQIERAAGDGLDLASDAFPYPVGNTTVNAVLPKWFLDGFYEKIEERAGVGRIAEGFWADLVLIDPQTVADRITPKHPGASLAGGLRLGMERGYRVGVTAGFCATRR